MRSEAERKKIFYANKAAKGKEQLAQPLSLAAQGIKGSHTSREAWYPLFECVKQRIQESIRAPKRYQPYTSCSHTSREAIIFVSL